MQVFYVLPRGAPKKWNLGGRTCSLKPLPHPPNPSTLINAKIFSRKVRNAWKYTYMQYYKGTKGSCNAYIIFKTTMSFLY